jgi:hypothetical protein
MRASGQHLCAAPAGSALRHTKRAVRWVGRVGKQGPWVEVLHESGTGAAGPWVNLTTG